MYSKEEYGMLVIFTSYGVFEFGKVFEHMNSI